MPLAAHLSQALDLSASLFQQLQATQALLDREREDKERERRRADQLAMEIHSYQRALAESAESLAEQRARVMQAEAHVAESVPMEHQAEGLKLDLPTPAKGWGSRLKRLLGISETRQTG